MILNNITVYIDIGNQPGDNVNLQFIFDQITTFDREWAFKVSQLTCSGKHT